MSQSLSELRSKTHCRWLGSSLLALLLAALVPGAAMAAQDNLRDAVAKAVLQNPEVKLRYHTYLSTGHDLRAVEGGFLPRVDLEAFAGRESRKTPLSPTEDYDHSGASLQIRQLLFDGFATRNDVRRLSHFRQNRYYEFLAAADDIALEATRAYIDVLRFRRLSELARDNFVIHRDLHRQLAEKTAAGVGRRVDLEQAAGRLALAESNWLTEAGNLHDVSARYTRIVGEAPPPVLAKLADLTPGLPRGVEVMETAVRSNPNFLAAVASVRTARADAQIRTGTHWPSLELRARTSHDRNQDGLSGTSRDNVVQLVMNYNLYKGGTDSARIRQFAEQLNAAYNLRDKACRDVQQTMQIAWNDMQRLQDQINLLEQYELSTAKARDAYRQQFDIGQRSLLDLLDTENELFSARRTLSSAEHDLQLAVARSLAASGRLLPSLEVRHLIEGGPETGPGTQPDDDALLCDPTLARSVVLDKSNLPPPVNLPPKPAVAAQIGPTPSPAAEVPAAAEPAKPVSDPLMLAVRNWAEAWRGKDVPAYLAAYAKSFVPPQGLTRAQWETMRDKRLQKPGKVQLTLEQMAVVSRTADKAEVRFIQRYATQDYKDEVHKTLEMVQEGGKWRIAKESVTQGRTF